MTAAGAVPERSPLSGWLELARWESEVDSVEVRLYVGPAGEVEAIAWGEGTDHRVRSSCESALAGALARRLESVLAALAVARREVERSGAPLERLAALEVRVVELEAWQIRARRLLESLSGMVDSTARRGADGVGL